MRLSAKKAIPVVVKRSAASTTVPIVTHLDAPSLAAGMADDSHFDLSNNRE